MLTTGVLENGDMAKKEEWEEEEKTIGSEDKKRRLVLKVGLLIGILLWTLFKLL